MTEYRPNIHTMGTTAFRRRLAHWIGCVRYGDDFIRIKRKGADPVYLISQADFDLMEKRRIEIDTGPWDPAIKGRREGIMAFLRRMARQEERGRRE